MVKADRGKLREANSQSAAEAERLALEIRQVGPKYLLGVKVPVHCKLSIRCFADKEPNWRVMGRVEVDGRSHPGYRPSLAGWALPRSRDLLQTAQSQADTLAIVVKHLFSIVYGIQNHMP